MTEPLYHTAAEPLTFEQEAFIRQQDYIISRKRWNALNGLPNERQTRGTKGRAAF